MNVTILVGALLILGGLVSSITLAVLDADNPFILITFPIPVISGILLMADLFQH